MNPTPSRRGLMTAGLAAGTGIALGTNFAFAQDAAPQGSPAQPYSAVAKLLSEAFSGTEYVLPKLPYAYDALEPHIDAKTMELHHSKHHNAYVEGVNKALKGLADARAAAEPSASMLEGLQTDLSFNGAGHLLHCLFFATMGPGAGGEPQGALAAALAKSFGSVEGFRTQFTRASNGVKGSGWAVLAYCPVSKGLSILKLSLHEKGFIPGMVPILPLDVWEHAYYLKHQNAKAKYVAAWWNVVNWPAVGEYYDSIVARLA